MVGWSETLVALKGMFSFNSARTDDFPQPYTMDSTTLTGQGALWGPVVVVVVVVVSANSILVPMPCGLVKIFFIFSLVFGIFC